MENFVSLHSLALYAIGHGVAILLVAFVSAVLLSPLLLRYAPTINAIDLPGIRRIHELPTPRCGGIAIYCGVHIACLCSYFAGGTGFTPAGLSGYSWLVVFVASSMALAVGLYDDCKPLNAPWKLSGQIATAVAIFALGSRVSELFGVAIPLLLSLIITVLWVVLLMNAFNLIDGLDGLAAGLAIIAGLGILGAVLSRDLTSDAIIIVALIGSCAGFVVWNRHPAKLFMGDGGSNLCGVILAVTSLHAGEKSTALGYLWMPMLAISIPLIDTFLAIWRRSIRLVTAKVQNSTPPHGIMTGDLDHLHHRMLNRGLSTGDVTATLCLVNALVVLVGLIGLPSQSNTNLMFIPLAGVVMLIFARIIPLREYQDSIRLIGVLLNSKRHRIVALTVLVIADLIGLSAALFCACILVHPDFPIARAFSEFTEHVIVWCGGGLMLLITSEIVPSLWRSRRLSAVLICVCSVLVCLLFLYGIYSELETRSVTGVTAQVIMFFILSTVFIGSFRWTLVCTKSVLRPERSKIMLHDLPQQLRWYAEH